MPRPTGAPAALAARDWGMLVAVALMWGSSYYFILLGLEAFPPATVAWLRLLLGVAVLLCVPAARAPLRRRRDLGPTAVLGLTWMAVPFLLFALAQQEIASALAGMVNGAAPLFTAAIATVWLRQRPDRALVVGLVVGFVGVVLLGLPNVDGRASGLGLLMVLLATFLYGVSFNLTGVLQARNGALSVILRAEIVAMLVLTPFGAPGLVGARPGVAVVLAMLALGALGTGLAFVLFTSLVGRVGAPRASITTYLVPVVSLVLGAGLAGERVALLSLAGVALVLVGAWLASGRRRSPA